MTDRDEAVAAFLASRDAACPKCGYNLRGVASRACPECGIGLTLSIHAERARRPATVLILLVLVWLALAGGTNATRAGIDIYEAGTARPRQTALIAQIQRQLQVQVLQLEQLQLQQPTPAQPRLVLPSDPPIAAASPSVDSTVTFQRTAPQVLTFSRPTLSVTPPPPNPFQWGAASTSDYVSASAWTLLALLGLAGLAIMLLSRRAKGVRLRSAPGFVAAAGLAIYTGHHVVMFTKDMLF